MSWQRTTPVRSHVWKSSSSGFGLPVRDTTLGAELSARGEGRMRGGGGEEEEEEKAIDRSFGECNVRKRLFTGNGKDKAR